MSSTTNSQTAGTKRAYQEEDAPTHHDGPASTNSPPLTTSSATSAFRNVSACNRCRVRKNRCDQRLPSCSTCEKASVRCVGYDPITKREIPRSYVYYLETRLTYFESLLKSNHVAYNAGDVFDADAKELSNHTAPSPTSVKASWPQIQPPGSGSPSVTRHEESEKNKDDVDKLVSNIRMVSVQGTSDGRYLGSTSGISFARVVLAAVKSSVSTNTSERAGIRPSRPVPNSGTTAPSSIRDTYFGLQTKPTIKEAPFPDRLLAQRLVSLYFEHANPQIPILHRDEFLEMFDRVYSVEPQNRTPRELYLLNIVFAIGAGIIWGSSDPDPALNPQNESAAKRAKLTGQQAQPEEYHASAIVHLGSILSASTLTDAVDRPGGELEELQAVLLLAGFALLRPVAPGLWYIVGVAMRLAVDLGLHYEDGTTLEDSSNVRTNGKTTPAVDAQERGRRQFVRDLRRRLWWCTYAFDRLVSTCVGRPFGISDQAVTTDLPSLLDDRYITRAGFLTSNSPQEPSYKRVAVHYLRLRLLQSEILQVLQYQQAHPTPHERSNLRHEFLNNTGPSPFLIQHSSFRAWRKDVDQRLYEWKESAPVRGDTGVSFSPQFLELNYWQAVIMLYRQSLTVPPPLADEFSPTADVSSPGSVRIEEKEDEDLVFLKCAEAGQKTLKLYRQLHRKRLVNYTYLATHHLFMAGISFLYAVWHSPVVRSRLTLDDFDFTVLAATSVLGDLMEKCPPAEACREAFERMSKATVQMCMSKDGFGFSRETGSPRHGRSPLSSRQISGSHDHEMHSEALSRHPRPIKARRPAPEFDTDLRTLFSDDLSTNIRPSQSFTSPLSTLHRLQADTPQYTSPFMQQESLQQHRLSSTGIASQVHTGLGMDPNNSFAYTPQAPPPATSPRTLRAQSRASTSVPIYMQNSYNPDFMNLSGMDFLMNSSANNPGQASNTPTITDPLHQPQSQPQHQYTNPPSSSTMIPLKLEDDDLMTTNTPETSNSAWDFGFGVQLDYQHDWSDGQQHNLLDDYFFGNNGMGFGGLGGGGTGGY